MVASRVLLASTPDSLQGELRATWEPLEDAVSLPTLTLTSQVADTGRLGSTGEVVLGTAI